MKIPLRYRIEDRWQYIKDFVHERVWLCEVRRSHQEKMFSEGRCIRCNRVVS